MRKEKEADMNDTLYEVKNSQLEKTIGELLLFGALWRDNNQENGGDKFLEINSTIMKFIEELENHML